MKKTVTASFEVPSSACGRFKRARWNAPRAFLEAANTEGQKKGPFAWPSSLIFNYLEKDLGKTILIPDSFFLRTVRFSVSPTVLKRYQCQFLHSWAPRGCQAGQSRTEEQGKDGPKEEVKKIDED